MRLSVCRRAAGCLTFKFRCTTLIPGMGTLNTTPDPRWSTLYRIGGICLFITGLFYFAAVVLAALLGPPPADAERYLRSLAAHSGLAFVNYAGFAVADLLLVPATLALYVGLRHLARSAMLVG